MSLLGSLFSVAAPIIGGLVGGPAGAMIGQAVGGLIAPKPAPTMASFATTQPFFAPGIPQIGLEGPPRVPVAQQLPPGVLANITGPLAARPAGVCPVGFHVDKRTGTRCVRNRRMNVLNPRAATRAIRRVRGARKMLQKIERQLPKAKARATPHRGHRHHVVEH